MSIHFKSILICCRVSFVHCAFSAVALPFHEEYSFGNAKCAHCSQTWQAEWLPCLDSEPVQERQVSQADREPGCQFPAWIKTSLWNPCNWILFPLLCKQSHLWDLLYQSLEMEASCSNATWLQTHLFPKLRNIIVQVFRPAQLLKVSF